MTDHIWDGRHLGGRRRRYKIAGCSRSLFPSIGSNNPFDEEFARPVAQPLYTVAETDLPFEEYVRRFWEENVAS